MLQVEQGVGALQAALPEGEGGDAQLAEGAEAAEAAEALQGVAALVSALLADLGKKAPEALLAPAAALHDSALLVQPPDPCQLASPKLHAALPPHGKL